MLSFSGQSGLGRNILVALLYTTSITAFRAQHYFDSIQNQNLLLDLLEHEGGDHDEDRIPGFSSTNVADLQKGFNGCSRRVIQLILEAFLWVPKSTVSSIQFCVRA